MPSRKQRRRRQKEQRHAYEYVYVDAEGREVEVAEDERPARNGTSQRAKPTARGARPGRTVEPPSMRRAARRGAIFAPFMFGVLYLLNQDLPLYGVAVNTLVLVAFFVPFGYGMDWFMYRLFVRRGGRPPDGKAKNA